MILLQILGVLGATATVSAVCDACFDSKCYTRTSLFYGHTIAGPLAIDRSLNIVYFYYYDEDYENFNVYFNLENVTLRFIPNIGFTYARTVDQITHECYLSGLHKVSKFNPQTKVTKSTSLENIALKLLQYKDKLYYKVLDQTGLYTFENGVSTSIPALSSYDINHFVVDKNNDIYFRVERASAHDIYKLKNNDTTANRIFENNLFKLATDKYGNAYVVKSRGLYKVDYSSDTPKFIEVGAFATGIPYSVVFDKDNNLVYHDLDNAQIWWLTKNSGDCTVSSSGPDKQLQISVISN